MSRVRVLACAIPLLALLALAPDVTGQTAATPGEWRTLEGSWSATGTRRTLPTEGGSLAAIVQVSGTVALSSGEGLSRGFRGEAIFFYDGVSLGVGRAVWTDNHGDRIFSSLKGEAVETGHRIVATVTGGTGRYAGVTGEYAFPWQVVVQAEDGVLQGRTVELKGRVRRGEGPR
jgi:hypothetical protein